MDSEQQGERELPLWARKSKKPKKPLSLGKSSSVPTLPERLIDHKNLPVKWTNKGASHLDIHDLHASLKLSPSKLKPFPDHLNSRKGKKEPVVQRVIDLDNTLLPMSLSRSSSAEQLQHDYKQSYSDSLARDGDDFLKIEQSDMQLEIFDSDDFETRNPEDWLKDGGKAKSYYFVDGEWQWSPCVAVSYDYDQHKYLCQFPVGISKYIRRINILFDVENRAIFESRLQAARALREEAKTALRFDHYLDNQPNDSVASIAPAWLDEIYSLATQPKKLAGVAETSKLLQHLAMEVVASYRRGIKKASFMYRVFHEEELLKYYYQLGLPKLSLPAPAPHLGKLKIDAEAGSFTSNVIFLNSHPLFSNKLTQSFFEWVQRSWHENFGNVSFFDTNLEGFSLPCELDAFNARQSKHIKSVYDSLMEDWRRAIKEKFEDNLQDSCNMFMSTVEEYDASPVSRLLKKLQLIMVDQLRELIHRSTDSFLEFLKPFGVESVRASYIIKSLFKVYIGVDDTNSFVQFSPSEGDFQNSLLKMIDSMCDILKGLTPLNSEVLTMMTFPSTVLLPLGIEDDLTYKLIDEQISSTRLDIQSVVKVGMTGPCDLLSKYNLFVNILQIDPDEHVKEFANKINSLVFNHAADANEEHPATKLYQNEISRFADITSNVETISFNDENFKFVCIETRKLKDLFISQADKISNNLMTTIVIKTRNECLDISKRYHYVLDIIVRVPTNEDELASLREYISRSKKLVEGMQHEVSSFHKTLDLVQTYGYRLSFADFELAWSLLNFPLQVEQAAKNSLESLEEEKQKMMENLEAAKAAFELDLESIAEKVKEFFTLSDWDQMDSIADKAFHLDTTINNAKNKANDFNQREAIFGWDKTEYSILEQMSSDFEPYLKLWTLCSDFKTNKETWLNGSFLALNSSEIEKSVSDWIQESRKLARSLSQIAPGPAETSNKLLQRSLEFQKNVPIVSSLASKALRKRHWDLLSDKLAGSEDSEHSINLVPDEDLTLQQLIDMDIIAHWDEVQEVTVFAEKEYNLEKQLEKMKEEWSTIEFGLFEYKDTGTSILKSVEDIVALLDDHIVKSQTMLGSPFIKNILQETKKWESTLQYTQLLIDEWLKVQRTWLYLEPIFKSEDIQRQMPTEARRFNDVDKIWRVAMEETKADPLVISDKNSKEKGQQEKFETANKKLDEIQKGLNDYLEVKRLLFPRFYFLSNDELLEILSQTKDPRRVQPHLGKCFEGIAAVQFAGDMPGKNKEDMTIMSMISGEGEIVPFIVPIDPNKGECKGNVELWLLLLQSGMRLTIKDICSKAFKAYPTVERKQWVLNWPGQVVIAGSCLFWTLEVTEAIKKGGVAATSKYEQLLNRQINGIVELVRGKLSKMDRTTLAALTVVDVHARDVVSELVKKEVSDPNDFEWMAQLRYYWEEKPDDYNRYGTDPYNLLPKIVNATIMYGYEYLGNSSRLVITPLTDRCYRTMMGAVSLMYGGAPSGPAGTGKTETVKDLSKAVAFQCVVFNCSDGLDYLAMAKFFKGLAASGAWACFDEFNRIELEVLSVIGQQVLTILEAKRYKKKMFLFEGTTLPLNPDCNSFITMNPGYAGRSELPDNLKTLFRNCAMMVPDYALIAEIKLYSFGFEHARILARKLTQVLRLSSEQLSSQKHYDYGMRAVFSILVRAGNLRQSLDWAEDLIVLSAVNDVNLPKFTTNDLPLFKGITSDLFPGATLPTPDYGPLIPMIETVAKSHNLQCKHEFISAVVQLYETIMVRHGLMIVGETYSGKTCIFRTLQQAMTDIKDHKDFPNGVNIITINPKSITQGQLYGKFDDTTHEWTDGVLAVKYREAWRDQTGDRQWILFDGPVDAVWIENMNTVLDDNKKLCLNSGEIIKMTSFMTMMFEAEDLEEASPATVSRVGMVFIEQSRLGWLAMATSWLESELQEPMKPYHEFILELFHWLIPPAQYCSQKEVPIPTPITPLELVASTLRLFKCLLNECLQEGAINPKNIHAKLENMVAMAIVWAMGAITNDKGRGIFDLFFKGVTSGELANLPGYNIFLIKNPPYVAKYKDIEPRRMLVLFPEDSSVFDVFHSQKSGKWVLWVDTAPKINIPRDAKYQKIVISTVGTIQTNFVTNILLTNGYHVMITGETGTGKTVGILDQLSGMDKEKFVPPIFLNFSAQTTANMVQDIIDGKLSKRRKGVFGPPILTRAIIFVDDLNLPAKETYGAQPPIEVLRQFMDHRGWYDLKDLSFRVMEDIQFVTAMGPPGGGRTRITQRYVRHFNMLALVPFDSASLKRIFNSVMDWFTVPFASRVKGISSSIVDATITMYDKISTNLLPTPLKSHYTFNLRDLSKVFQGITLSGPDRVSSEIQMIRLWAHECLRVFYDRLIDDPDRQWFMKNLSETITSFFKKDWDKDIRGKHPQLIYGNFINAQAPVKLYDELEDREKLSAVMTEYLEDYNTINTKKMHLVLFMNAVEHIARMSRCINQSGGNVLMVGVGGSGRKSVTKLAIHMAEFQLFQVEIAKGYGMVEWRDDLRRLLRMAGEQNKETVFLFSDTQIVKETFVEDISNILNTGEVPNLFPLDELQQICENVSKAAKEAGRNEAIFSEVYSFFVERCRAKLHCILAFSPIGNSFRTRLRMFPSLVNCCTIDWFTEWPEEALRSVANRFLQDVELEANVKLGVVAVCVDMQERVTQLSKQFFQELRRYYYVTPTSYLELINTFKTLIDVKRTQVSTKKFRYINGLTKLEETASQVAGMQKELTDLQPKLKIKQAETNDMLIKIDSMQKGAMKTKAVVEKEEAVCKIQADSANKMKAECKEKLDEAEPAVKKALAALGKLTKAAITEVKALKNPPGGVKLTMEVLCPMMGVAPKKVAAPDGKGKIDDYWEPAQKQILGDPKFLDKLVNYDKDNISDEVIAKIEPYMTRDDFDPKVIYGSSQAAGGLCEWIHAMYVYNTVAKVVAPMKIALQKASDELETTMSALAEKQHQLKEVMDNLAELQAVLKKTQDEKESLEKQVLDCSNKLDRAQRLIGGLGGEKKRWTEFASQLTDQYNNLVGDVLLASGAVAYLGCFTANYREECFKGWSALLQSKGITCANNFDLSVVLGNPVEIRNWVINKLPNDSFSIHNAIMLQKSNRFPLMIDPQGQANKWVRNLEKANNLIVVKQSHAKFVNNLERGIQLGFPVLLENVPEFLEAVLETILQKQITTIGNMRTIRVGDNNVEYNPNFKLYITTRLRNPHYPPETCVQVNLLNFMATREGLEDQLLGVLVAKEQPVLEEKREALVLQDAENKRKLQDIEDEILYLLAHSQGNILDDETLISTLGQSKITSDEIMKAVAIAEKTSEEIMIVRKGYQPVAYRASILFFCIAELASVEPMYQYSLEFYVTLFLMAIKEAEKSNVLLDRLNALKETFMLVLYKNVCRSLFGKDKLLFSFLLCARVLIGDNMLDANQLRFFLAGSTAMGIKKPKPSTTTNWLNDNTWKDFEALNDIPGFAWVCDSLTNQITIWFEIYNSTDPSAILAQKFKDRRLNTFARLLIVRCIRLDKVIPCLQDFIAESIGKKFIDPPGYDLESCFADSTCTSPIIFVLSPGADPMSDLLRLAEKKGMSKKLHSVSLGQGQGPIAEEAIGEAVDKGMWVCLQNCHLAASWMPALEKIVEEITVERSHPEFRLWLTSMPSEKFPSVILQNGVKVTQEPPKGLRANLLGTYVSLEESWFEGCVAKPAQFKKMLFGICFFHAIVRERCKYGPLGWNIAYEFSVPDLLITRDQLKLFLEEYEHINFEALSYLAAECNYGGRVTDDKDRRCINTILTDYYDPKILTDEYKFSPSGVYFAPKEGHIKDYIEYIKSLPLLEQPEVFGLHENADIAYARNETSILLETALSLQPRASGGGGKSWEQSLVELAGGIEERVPPIFDVEKVEVLYPVVYDESMNTVLTQELMRFNNLLIVIKKSLREVQKAIKGVVVMSSDLERMGGSMVNGWVPDMWKAVAYPSKKPLGSWVTDLLARLKFLAEWVDKGKPDIYWISGFFFTQSFLTGTRQNYARKYKIPIDEIEYDYEIFNNERSLAINKHAPDGAYVNGLFLDSARWDDKNLVLVESKPKELFVTVPVIWLLPREIKVLKEIDLTRHAYHCPTYKTSERKGTLSTTGQSTNFVMTVFVPMSKRETQKHWIKRGVAMLTQLDT